MRRLRTGVLLAAGLLFMSTGCTWLPGVGDRSTDETAGSDPDRSEAAEGTAQSVPGLALLDPQHADREIAHHKRELAHRDDRAITPADAGYYMDILEAELRQALQHSAVETSRRETSVLLRIPGLHAFATGREHLKETAKPLLARVAEVAGRYEATLVIVDSHTDPTGDADTNLELSKRRAIAVSRYLVDQGIDIRRIIAFGHGESRPLAESESNAADGSSRRIEIRLAPIIRESAAQDAG